jgi:GntR family transcriptional regulator, rspAB operon transcriptional repressor
MGAKEKTYDFLDSVKAPQRGGATVRVAEALREAIASLELPPGAFLDKTALCARLGVSRFPVSEALSRLQVEGLVQIQPQRGSIVSLIRLADARENMFLRRALEVEAVRTLAPIAGGELRTSLRRNLSEQAEALAADDRATFHALDLAFHEMLLDATGFHKVKQTVECARIGLDRIRRILTSPDIAAATRNEHQSIVEGIETGDGEKAATAMRTHLDAVMVRLMCLAEKRPNLFTDWPEVKAT